MELSKGLIVRSIAGHDKGDFQIIMQSEGEYAWVCDGKTRKIEKHKRKNRKHIQLTSTQVQESAMLSNKAIREALKEYRKIRVNSDVESKKEA